MIQNLSIIKNVSSRPTLFAYQNEAHLEEADEGIEIRVRKHIPVLALRQRRRFVPGRSDGVSGVTNTPESTRGEPCMESPPATDVSTDPSRLIASPPSYPSGPGVPSFMTLSVSPPVIDGAGLLSREVGAEVPPFAGGLPRVRFSVVTVFLNAFLRRSPPFLTFLFAPDDARAASTASSSDCCPSAPPASLALSKFESMSSPSFVPASNSDENSSGEIANDSARMSRSAASTRGFSAEVTRYDRSRYEKTRRAAS